MATKRYSGRLVSPITRAQSLTFEGAVTQDRAADFHRAHDQHELTADNDQRIQETEKIALLMQHFQITGNDMGALVLALARRHVPGFKVVPEKASPGGRKRIWDGPKLRRLLEAVEEAKQNNRRSDRQALKFITSNAAKSEDWHIPAKHKGTQAQWIETLESRLNEAKKYVASVDLLPSILAQISSEQIKFRKR